MFWLNRFISDYKDYWLGSSAVLPPAGIFRVLCFKLFYFELSTFADILPPWALMRFLYSLGSIMPKDSNSFISLKYSWFYSGNQGMMISNRFSLASNLRGYNVGSFKCDLWCKKNFPQGLHVNLVFFRVPSWANLRVFVVFIVKSP